MIDLAVCSLRDRASAQPDRWSVYRGGQHRRRTATDSRSFGRTLIAEGAPNRLDCRHGHCSTLSGIVHGVFCSSTQHRADYLACLRSTVVIVVPGGSQSSMHQPEDTTRDAGESTLELRVLCPLSGSRPRDRLVAEPSALVHASLSGLAVRARDSMGFVAAS